MQAQQRCGFELNLIHAPKPWKFHEVPLACPIAPFLSASQSLHSPLPDPHSRPSSRSRSLLRRHPLHICGCRRDFDRQLQKEQPSERTHVRHCSAISALLLLAPLWLKPAPSGCRWTGVTLCIFSGRICGRASNSCEWTACSTNREHFRCPALRVFFPNSPACSPALLLFRRPSLHFSCVVSLRLQHHTPAAWRDHPSLSYGTDGEKIHITRVPFGSVGTLRFEARSIV